MKKRNKVAIELRHVTKEYVIHHEKPTLMEKFIKGGDERFVAIKNINITIKQGERVGVVGLNGCGKTTLLKIIAGITTPTSGSVRTRGKTVSLINLEAGFHPDLTGEQNIYLNGMILGMKKKEITKNFNKIIDFADIGQFIDAPLFTYSVGMVLRVGFSIAVHSNPDILLLDEGMVVGDGKFQQKTQKKIRELYKLGKTIIMVSHWLEFLQLNTDRIIVLTKGLVTHDGGKETIEEYKKNIGAI
jgi:ABC-type polysaccharide/polyol phosphate transport system ATPase subunit